MSLQALADQVRAGDRLATARAISLVEDDFSRAETLLDSLHEQTGKAWRIGITGPPGAGKSTLVAALVALWREDDAKVAVIAVDPTSPFTGGALLGDRIRMSRLSTDPNVFIRSMATRGSLGGLGRRTSEAADILDAAGYDPIFIETVGVGQSEVDVASAADSTVVVLSPESGDGIQAMKAGLREIADIFAVNKADRDGAQRLIRAIEATLDLAPGGTTRPAVCSTVATRQGGVADLKAALHTHQQSLEQGGQLQERRRSRLSSYVRTLVEARSLQDLWASENRQARFDAMVEKVAAGEISPYEAARGLLG